MVNLQGELSQLQENLKQIVTMCTLSPHYLLEANNEAIVSCCHAATLFCRHNLIHNRYDVGGIHYAVTVGVGKGRNGYF